MRRTDFLWLGAALAAGALWWWWRTREPEALAPLPVAAESEWRAGPPADFDHPLVPLRADLDPAQAHALQRRASERVAALRRALAALMAHYRVAWQAPDWRPLTLELRREAAAAAAVAGARGAAALAGVADCWGDATGLIIALPAARADAEALLEELLTGPTLDRLGRAAPAWLVPAFAAVLADLEFPGPRLRATTLGEADVARAALSEDPGGALAALWDAPADAFTGADGRTRRLLAAWSWRYLLQCQPRAVQALLSWCAAGRPATGRDWYPTGDPAAAERDLRALLAAAGGFARAGPLPVP